MSLRVSEIPSLECLYRKLGYGADYRERYGTLYHSTRRWSETYVDHNGTTGQSMIHWRTAKGKSNLEELSQKFLDESHGIKLWPQTSGGGLEYPRDQKKLVALLAQLFWKQNTNIDKADRKRSSKRQKQHDQIREAIPFIHANTHTTGSSMAQGQSCYEGSLASGIIPKDYSPSHPDPTRPEIYDRARLDAGDGHVHATQLYANGCVKGVLNAQELLPLTDQQESPLNLQNDTALSALTRTLSNQVRTGADVYDYVGSDDERQVREHRHDLYQNCKAICAGMPAPIANMTNLPTPPVAVSNEIPKRHAISPDQSWATNGLSEIREGLAHDNPRATTPRRALKGAWNVSGLLSRARSGTTEVDGIEQRPLDVIEASIIPSKENDVEVLSGQITASEALSDTSVDNDDEADKTYTPGKASKAKRGISKRPKMFIDKSKATKKQRLGVKRQDDKAQSLHLKDLHSSELHLDGETSSIAKPLQLGPGSSDTSLARASGERADLEHSLPSSAHTHPKASGWEVGRRSADLKVKGQEFTCPLGPAPSTQTREGEGNGGDDRMHMERTCDGEKMNNCYEDGSHENPILVHEESPPPVEDRPLYPWPTSWQSDLAAATKAIGGMVGVEKALAPLNQDDSAEIKDEQNGLPYHSTKDMPRGECGSVARSIAFPFPTLKIGRVLQSPPLAYYHARGQSGGEGYALYSPSQRAVSTGRPQDLDWKRDANARPVSMAMVPHDTERATNIFFNPYTKPATDVLASPNRRIPIQNEADRTCSPDPSIKKRGGQDSGLSRIPTKQPNHIFLRTTQTTPSSPPPHSPRERPKFTESWFVRVNKPSSGPRKYRHSDLHLADMTLASTFDEAATEVPPGTDIRSIALTISSYQHDKGFPKLTETVDRDDGDGFDGVKLEFMDSIREYVEEGATDYNFVVEVNPRGKRGRRPVFGEGDGVWDGVLADSVSDKVVKSMAFLPD